MTGTALENEDQEGEEDVAVDARVNVVLDVVILLTLQGSMSVAK